MFYVDYVEKEQQCVWIARVRSSEMQSENMPIGKIGKYHYSVLLGFFLKTSSLFQFPVEVYCDIRVESQNTSYRIFLFKTQMSFLHCKGAVT